MTDHTPAPAPQDFVATELRGIINVCGDSPTAIVSVERMRLWLSKLRAPVAGEAQQPYCYVLETRDRDGLLLDVEFNGSDSFSGGRKGGKPLYDHAAPQASEVVRQQRAGDVVAVLVYRSKGRSGVHGQTIGADGAGEFAVLYRGDEFAALVKANQEIRELEAAGHRLDFAAIIHGDGYSGPMLRQEYVTRAALSAQPGAQKNGGSDA